MNTSSNVSPIFVCKVVMVLLALVALYSVIQMPEKAESAVAPTPVAKQFNSDLYNQCTAEANSKVPSRPSAYTKDGVAVVNVIRDQSVVILANFIYSQKVK